MKMIPHSKPIPSKELLILSYLHPRMKLPPSEKQNFEYLKKGYAGEVKFYTLLCDRPSNHRIALFDLLLEGNNSEFQIDSLIINQNTVYPLEIKNFNGDYYIDGDNWYAVRSGKEIRNPLMQLQRSEYLIKYLLEKLNVKLTIKPYIVFVNDAFTLYHAPLGQPFIFPTQLKKFIHKLSTNPTPPTVQQRWLSEKLIDMHIEESVNSRLPEYEYDQLEKGMFCSSCSNPLSLFMKIKLKCHSCNTEEDIERAVLRSVSEYQLLFPKRRVTTGSIYDWCRIIHSKKIIRRILLKHLTLVQNGKYSYYLLK